MRNKRVSLVLCLLFVLSAARGKTPADFLCEDGSHIALRRVCDGSLDCRDGSDEMQSLCKHVRCGAGAWFQCHYGACVEKSAVCDGKHDCADGSDESHCGRDTNSCNSTELRCDSGECLSHRRLCDGHVDCTDGSDEASDICADFPCPDHAFRCDSGSCVSMSSLCDGSPQCPDGSDESSRRCPGRSCGEDEGCHPGCREGEFSCGSGECVGQNHTCDGRSDCEDASDETLQLCADKLCPVGWFRCRYGACITTNRSCDGTADCADWSDEECGKVGEDCRLPWTPRHTHYVVQDCPKCRPGARASPGQRLDYLCDEGHVLRGSSSVLCSNSSWTPHLPHCVPASGELLCPAIASSRLTVTCEAVSGRGRSWVSCDSPVAVGTVAHYNCRQYYEPDGSEHTDNTQAVCLRTGRWDRQPLRCRPECGKLGTEATPLVVHGQQALYGVYPWVAALYLLQDGVWSFWCGGSLISEVAVITAGHCVWKAKADSVRIALGKYYRDYNKTHDLTQLRDVRQIIIQPVYHDVQGNYGSDIAVLMLASPVELSAAVRPVCVDWQLQRTDSDLQEGSLGVAAGWGLNENDTFSDVMKTTRLPVVALNNCIASQPRDFKKYVSFTTLCAGYRNGTGVCNGDSGGGLVFPGPSSNSSWVLQGIVSVSPRRRTSSFCDLHYHTIFTKVSVYVQWLRSVLWPTADSPGPL